MISSTEWLARVRASMKPRNEDSITYDTESLLKFIELAWKGVTPEEIEEEKVWHAELEKPKPKSYTDLFKWPGLAYFFEPHEAKKVVEDDHLMDNFLWDRATQILVTNTKRGAHELLMGNLFAAYTGVASSINCKDQAAEYIAQGMGFCLSSAGMRPIKGEDVKLNAQEKAIFGRFRFVEIK